MSAMRNCVIALPSIFRLVILATLLVIAGVAPVRADPVAEFYKSKVLNLILGFATGGGYDTYGRTIARHLPRHLSGQPTIVVQNMPGGGSLRAANYLYNVPPKDGSVIGMISSATAFEPMFGNKAAQFDTPQFSWIGNIDETIGTCGVWHASGVSTFEDLLDKEITFGGTAEGGVGVQHVMALKNLFGAKIKLIRGYEGASGINLALQRGEVDGACALALSSLKTSWQDDWRSGRLKPIVQLAIEKHPDLPGVTHIYDYAKTEEDRQVFDLIFGRHVLGRPLLGPPKVPAERVTALREAFMATMSDPLLLADAQKLDLEITPSSGAQVEETMRRFFAYPQSVVEKAIAAME